MYNRLESVDAVEYDGYLTKAVDNETTREIKTLMLDGSVSIQIIGDPVTSIDVEYYCETPVRRLLQTCAREGTPIVVCNEDKIWTGIISGGIRTDPFISEIDEKLTFVVMATGVEDR